jgi:hypothetical protein
MARIRTIKPEFPQSESMGRISREARLTFVLLWTLADDAGRLRGNSRMLASLLFPYDDDAPSLIDGWLSELTNEGCITRYLADGGAYVQIDNWLEHQKIDKPSRSKIPTFDEASRMPSKPRESSSEDLRTKDQGPRIKEGTPREGASPPDDLGEAMGRWNSLASELQLSKAESLSGQRRKKLAARLAEIGGLPGWDRAIAKIRGSPFLQGNNARKWRVSFDFLLQPESLARLLEGKYDEMKSGVDQFFEDLTNGPSRNDRSGELDQANDPPALAGQLRPPLKVINS